LHASPSISSIKKKQAGSSWKPQKSSLKHPMSLVASEAAKQNITKLTVKETPGDWFRFTFQRPKGIG
jgi:hypothetical protein